ncbi:MAG: peptidoglycan recognition family protein [Patescibacteria group bacterium]
MFVNEKKKTAPFLSLLIGLGAIIMSVSTVQAAYHSCSSLEKELAKKESFTFLDYLHAKEARNLGCTLRIRPIISYLKNGTTEETSPVATDQSGEVVKPEILPRSEWNAREPLSEPEEGYYAERRRPIRYIGIHHTDTPKTYSIGPMQEYHINMKGWGDIAYHYLIDHEGNIYEGRDTSKCSDTASDSDNYKGTLCSIINIALIGDFSGSHELGETQMQALQQLTAWVAQRYDISRSNVRGHKDFILEDEPAYGQINCPGDNVYSRMNEIRGAIR